MSCGERSFAEVAQSVEHMTENHGVGSSILPLGTNATTNRWLSGAICFILSTDPGHLSNHYYEGIRDMLLPPLLPQDG